jgi:uracil DNA glycosylase
MCNAALTTEIGKAGSHLAIWEPFMKFLLSEVLDFTYCPIVYFGKEAAKYKRYASPFTYNYVVSHPASAAYKHSEWDSEGVFTKINNHIKLSNDQTIEWLTFTEV